MNYKKASLLICTVMFICIIIPQKAYAGEIPVNGVTISYRVMSGDTLGEISQQFDTTTSEIMRINNLPSTMINIGQILKVYTGPRVSVLYYTVQPGDTLWAVAYRMGVSINSIMSVSGLYSSMINVGQQLIICYKNPVAVVNYRAVAGETVWDISKKYGTSIDAILKSNYMNVDYFMPGQIVTVPVNSISIAKPVGIGLMKSKTGNYYGDIYTWDEGRRLFTVGTEAVAKDVMTGITWKIKYYGGSNHADIITATQKDTDIMYKVFGSRWSWLNKRPVIIFFSQGGAAYQIACSLIGMPHSTTNIIENGMQGHCCLYFYNSIGHSNPEVDPVSQANVLKANGQ